MSAPSATALPAREGSGRSSPAPPRLADPDAVENIVRNGRRTMPAVGSGWTTEQIDALTNYLQENPPDGS